MSLTSLSTVSEKPKVDFIAVKNQAKLFHQSLIDKVYNGSNYSFYTKIPTVKNGIQIIGMYVSEIGHSNRTALVELIKVDGSPINENRTLYEVSYNPNYATEYPLLAEDRYGVPVDELKIVYVYTVPEIIQINNRIANTLSTPLDADPKVLAAQNAALNIAKNSLYGATIPENKPVQSTDIDMPEQENEAPATRRIPGNGTPASPIVNIGGLKPKKELVNDASFSDMTIRDLFAILHARPVSNKSWLNDLITG